MSFKWFEIVSKSSMLHQGDFVEDCPIVVPPVNFEADQDILVKNLNAIIMSQSCDLENGKIEIVLVCPYYNLEYFLNSHPTSKNGGEKGRKKTIENLAQGNFPSYHLLNKFDNESSDYIVVDFKNVYGVSFDFLKNKLEKVDSRLRLLPPYREHLSQAFARYFMRVGLPINISIP